MSLNINSQYTHSKLSDFAGEILYSINSSQNTSNAGIVKLTKEQSNKIIKFFKEYGKLSAEERKCETIPFRSILLMLNKVENLPLTLKVIKKAMKAYDSTLGKLQKSSHTLNSKRIFTASQELIQQRESFLSLLNSLKKLDPDKQMIRFNHTHKESNSR